jgi:hypothetical protein
MNKIWTIGHTVHIRALSKDTYICTESVMREKYVLQI